MFDTRHKTKIEADNFIFFDVGLLYFIADLFLFCCLIFLNNLYFYGDLVRKLKVQITLL